MGLMRAFSMKLASTEQLRCPSGVKGRPQISLPMEMISSTNEITSTAPSVLVMQQAVKDAANTRSPATPLPSVILEEHNGSTSTSPSVTSRSISRRCSDLSTASAPSMTDDSSTSSSPCSPELHLPSRTAYFTMDTLTKPSSNRSSSSLSDDSIDPFTIVTPAIPRRAASHSKQEHVRLARRRSERQSLRDSYLNPSVVPPSNLDGIAANDSLASVLPTVIPEVSEADEEVGSIEDVIPQICVREPQSPTLADISQGHPFSQELEQLNEAVEELSASEQDEDTRIMHERGLKRWSVTGYLDLIDNAWSDSFATFRDL